MLEHIFLGIVQGLTEFLPVSSSGHLVVLQKLMGMNEEVIARSVILHMGTVFALFVFFREDIKKALRDKTILLFIAIVTVLTGFIGVMGKNFFEELFSTVRPVAYGWMITGVMLLCTKKFLSATRKDLTFKDVVVLGITQGIAIIPGVSRSGTTISTLLFRKIERETAFRFSFLVSIPAICGAALLEAKDVGLALSGNALVLAAGFLASFITGLCALAILKSTLQKARFHYFGYYCITIAVLTLIFVR